MGASSVVRSLRAVIVLGLVSAALVAAGAGRASAAPCESWGGLPPNVGSGDNQLQGVAVTSSCNAWAVGHYLNLNDSDQTLIERWNGNAWKIQASQNPGGPGNTNDLSEVAAVSPRSAWAVGSYYNGTADRTLIERWNGKKWKVQTSPNPGGSRSGDYLSGVAASSSTNAWAVGYYYDGTSYHTLIERWNGKTWKVESSPTVAGYRHNAGGRIMRGPTVGLNSVAATSSSNAWAVGFRTHAAGIQTLVEHWNGKAWKVQPSQNPGGSGKGDRLSSVTATSSANAWAVGSYVKNSTSPSRTLIEHWSGKAWKVQPSPNAGSSGDANGLSGVAATSSANAWAVGNYGGAADPPLVEWWNGKAWKVQPSANLDNSFIYGVAASSSHNAWAVGYYNNGTNLQALALHCC